MKNDVSCSYTYDGEQRMASATCGGVTTQYVYDGEGQRVAKLNPSGAVSEQDVYNTAGRVIMRYNASGGWTEGEVWAEGNHLAIYANGQTYFPITDQVGTERARFSYTGGIVQTCMSQPFGDNLQCTGTDSSPYKFGKLERDGESGDDHAQHRDYNSNPYRWLTPDPAGQKVVVLTDPQTWNMYMYSHDNPATDNDPTGLCTVDNEQHNWLWCGAHKLGLVETQHELANDFRTWLSQTTIYRNGKQVDLSKESDQSVISIGNQVSQQQFEANRPEALMGLTPKPIPGYPYMDKPNVTNRELQDIVDDLFQPTDQVPGGTAGGVRYERITGELLSEKGHVQDAQNLISRLNTFLRNNPGLSANDQAVAKELILDLQNALKGQ
jgi:RHS repeat-associated protein